MPTMVQVTGMVMETLSTPESEAEELEEIIDYVVDENPQFSVEEIEKFLGNFNKIEEDKIENPVEEQKVCPECSAEVSSRAKFCRECGHKFVTACPKCGAAVNGGKFCPECGEKL